MFSLLPWNKWRLLSFFTAIIVVDGPQGHQDDPHTEKKTTASSIVQYSISLLDGPVILTIYTAFCNTSVEKNFCKGPVLDEHVDFFRRRWLDQLHAECRG